MMMATLGADMASSRCGVVTGGRVGGVSAGAAAEVAETGAGGWREVAADSAFGGVAFVPF